MPHTQGMEEAAACAEFGVDDMEFARSFFLFFFLLLLFAANQKKKKKKTKQLSLPLLFLSSFSPFATFPATFVLSFCIYRT
jgi:hypothetical protein